MSRDLVFTLLALGAPEYDYRAVDIAIDSLTSIQDVEDFHSELTSYIEDDVEMQYAGGERSRVIDEQWGNSSRDVAKYMAAQMIYERLPYGPDADSAERLVLARWSTIVQS
jgi:hypothetical protein